MVCNGNIENCLEVHFVGLLVYILDVCALLICHICQLYHHTCKTYQHHDLLGLKSYF
jgi:hypothetical protein